MAWALDEFFAALEAEFDLEIPEVDRLALLTPGDVIDYLVEESDYASELDEEARRDEIANCVGEIMAESLGISRYQETSRFLQDLRVR